MPPSNQESGLTGGNVRSLAMLKDHDLSPSAPRNG